MACCASSVRIASAVVGHFPKGTTNIARQCAGLPTDPTLPGAPMRMPKTRGCEPTGRHGRQSNPIRHAKPVEICSGRNRRVPGFVRSAAVTFAIPVCAMKVAAVRKETPRESLLCRARAGMVRMVWRGTAGNPPLAYNLLRQGLRQRLFQQPRCRRARRGKGVSDVPRLWRSDPEREAPRQAILQRGMPSPHRQSISLNLRQGGVSKATPVGAGPFRSVRCRVGYPQ